MPPNAETDTIFNDLAWVHPYFLDWGKCGSKVFLIRAHSTVLRWFQNPRHRRRLLKRVLDWVPEGRRTLPGNLQTNMFDLIDSETPLAPNIPAGPFGLFLSRLAAGDIITGGPTSPDWPQDLVKIRPGYFFVRTAWDSVFTDLPMPWPFWTFPSTLPPGEL